MIYFDNAASSHPKPDSVVKSVTYWLKRNGANAGRSGHRMSVEASQVIYDTRVAISELFGVSELENIAFVPNATYGINLILFGILRKGDHIVITDLEHNSVLRPVYFLSKFGISYSVAETDLYNDDVTINNVLNKVQHNTKLVICTQCSNVCGKVMPVKQLKAKLPKHVMLFVDGSQGAGIVPINLEAEGVDYYCAPSHKSLMGPQGTGFVSALSNNIMPTITGGTGSDSFNLKHPDYMPDVLEAGTMPVAIIAGLLSGIKYITKKGVENIYEHKKKMCDYFYKEIENNDRIIKYIDYKRGLFVGTACFNIKDMHSETVAKELNDNGICVRGGFHCAPLFHQKMNTESNGMVRISFGEFNTISEINQLVKILNKI